MSINKKIGYWFVSPDSNKSLLKLFEQVQRVRIGGSDSDWNNDEFVKKLTNIENEGRKLVLKLMLNKQLHTFDDFYRASFLFLHGTNSEEYALAIGLATCGAGMGDKWCKNMIAVATDRLLLSLGLSQHFGTQIGFDNGKHFLLKLDSLATDRERKEYFVDSLNEIRKKINILNNNP